VFARGADGLWRGAVFDDAAGNVVVDIAGCVWRVGVKKQRQQVQEVPMPRRQTGEHALQARVADSGQTGLGLPWIHGLS